jgi:uncharacterized protein DUF6141
MGTNILFQEVQSFNKKQLQLYLKIAIGLFLIALATNMITNKGTVSLLTTILCWGLIISMVAAFFTTSKMVTQIRTDGIYVSFSPFHPWFDKYSWDNIEEVYLREYDALSEYLGWGIKIGPSGRGYIVSGNVGIQLSLIDQSKILIGTEQADEVKEILSSLKTI